jgi:hypothetical protein
MMRPKLDSVNLNKLMLTFSKPPFEPTLNSSELSSQHTSRVESPLTRREARHDREALALHPPQLSAKDDAATAADISAGADGGEMVTAACAAWISGPGKTPLAVIFKRFPLRPASQVS